MSNREKFWEGKLEHYRAVLKEAQKEISELKTANDFLNQENQTLKELAGKIEAANKILENHDNVDDCQEWLKQMRGALQVPRNDEQKHKIKVPWDFAGISEQEYYDDQKKICLFKGCEKPKSSPSVFCLDHKEKFNSWLSTKENTIP